MGRQFTAEDLRNLDQSTPEARALVWRLWYAAAPHQRSNISPTCYTCGRPPVSTFQDHSPKFNCHIVGHLQAPPRA